MLVVDDVLLAPVHGLMWVFRKIDRAAREELENRGERLKKELSDLYMQLETGRLSEQEFDAREKQILDQLDRLKKTKAERATGGQPAETQAPSPPPTSSQVPPPPAPAEAAPPAPSPAPPAPSPTSPASSPAPTAEPSAAAAPSAPRHERRWAWAAAAAGLVGVAGAVAWRRGARTRPEKATPASGPRGDPEGAG